MKQLSVLWHWGTMGPYHFARMEALRREPGIELRVAESCSQDDHNWARQGGPSELRLTTLIDGVEGRARQRAAAALRQQLDEVQPDIVVATGYANAWTRREALRYKSARPEARLVLWSESTARDHRRVRSKEFVKRLMVRAFDGALVAGKPHAEYLESLGMPASRIRLVGGCVDNDYFRSNAAEFKRTPANSQAKPHFLYVGRFVRQKNLLSLLEAYRKYRQGPAGDWTLVLVGDGPERPAIEQFVARHHIDSVVLAGLRQYRELPGIYASAGCFVLPSASEPWGLVVNEAMACGLPILASTACGCVQHLVRPGENGQVFDPDDPGKLAALMHEVSSGKAPLAVWGENSRILVDKFSPTHYARNAAEHFRFLSAGKADFSHKQERRSLTAVRVLGKIEALTEGLRGVGGREPTSQRLM